MALEEESSGHHGKGHYAMCDKLNKRNDDPKSPQRSHHVTTLGGDIGKYNYVIECMVNNTICEVYTYHYICDFNSDSL